MRKMKNIKSIFAALICITLSVIGFSSCDWSFLNGGVATFASLEDEETDVFNERQIPKEEFFYVKVSDARSARKGDRFDYLMYARHEKPGVACKVPVNQESSEDLYCMLDVLEGDLLFQDITLEYNVPENMCDYVEFKLPWHYNQKVGRGLETVYSITDEGEKSYYKNDPLYSSLSLSSVQCDDCAQEDLFCLDGGTPSLADCEADVTDAEPSCINGEPKCDGGTIACNNGEVSCDGEGTLTVLS